MAQAEVTYYFNARHESEVWINPDNMVDNNLETYASTAAKGASPVQRLTGNTCPGTDLGAILKVEIRAYAYGDGDDKLVIRAEYLWGSWTEHVTVPGVAPGSWGAWQDITNDIDAPDWSLWSHIQDLDCDIEYITVGKANIMYCAKVEIRVTYSIPYVPSDIYVGADPIDRAATISAGLTYVDRNTPANATGILQNVKVFAYEDISGLIVGTFYTTDGNTLKCRDSVAIGDVAAGAERTFTGLSITVQEGDYIGCYFTAGSMEGDIGGFYGFWYVSGEYIDPGDETEYGLYSSSAFSLYGYGDFEAPPVGQPYISRVQGVQGMRSWGGI